MSEALAQALRLTALGMGMTFASIGALALGMLAMTYLTNGSRLRAKDGRERKTLDDRTSESQAKPATAESIPAGHAVVRPEAAAAAAAVGVALARLAEDHAMEAAQAAAAAVAVSLIDQQGSVSSAPSYPGAAEPWNSYVRGAHLSRRARYESQRRK